MWRWIAALAALTVAVVGTMRGRNDARELFYSGGWNGGRHYVYAATLSRSESEAKRKCNGLTWTGLGDDDAAVWEIGIRPTGMVHRYEPPPSWIVVERSKRFELWRATDASSSLPNRRGYARGARARARVCDAR